MKFMVTKVFFSALTVLALTSLVRAEDVTLTIESWRSDDLVIWQDKIIPAFETSHPGIRVRFTPTAPAEYNAVLNARLEADSAGDLITCRPFDASLSLYEKGYLAPVQDLEGMKNFSEVAKAGWSVDDGSVTFCVPIASVIHGFIYNADVFEKIGVESPDTVEEFFAVLDKIRADGNYIPMAMGTNDQWEAATMGYYNIGPNYWEGEKGRLALIGGEAKLTDEEWIAPFRQLERWKNYLGDGFEAQTYADSQNLFTLGRAVIYPAGSWEISGFKDQASFKMGAFFPPVRKVGDECYISDHTDIGIGLNAGSKHIEAARIFLNWVASAEFANLYANALPGFFSLSNHPVKMTDPLAQEFVSWRETCKSSIRPSYQILSRGKPNLENEIWNASVAVIKGKETPEAAGERLQKGLDSWYEPKMKQ